MSIVGEGDEALSVDPQSLVAPPRALPLSEDPLLGILLVVGAVVGLVLVGHFHLTGLIVAAVPAALVTIYIGVRRPLVALVVLQVVAWSGASGVLGNHDGFSLYTGALVVGVVSSFLAMRRDHIQPFGVHRSIFSSLSLRSSKDCLCSSADIPWGPSRFLSPTSRT